MIVFDTENMTWQQMNKKSDLCEALDETHYIITPDNQNILLFGGESLEHKQQNARNVSNRILCFNFQTEKWSYMPGV